MHFPGTPLADPDGTREGKKEVVPPGSLRHICPAGKRRLTLTLTAIDLFVGWLTLYIAILAMFKS